MEQPQRYFYSTDGADVRGPVAADVLRSLYNDKVITTATHICREGENEWTLFNPDDFRIPGGPTKLKPYEPPPYVLTEAALERMKEMPEQWEGESIAPTILLWIGIVLAAAGAGYVGYLRASQPDLNQSLLYNCAVGVCIFIVGWGLPALVTVFFPELIRQIVRIVAVIGIFAFLIVYQINLMTVRAQQEAGLQRATAEIREKLKENSEKQASNQSTYSNTSEVDKDMNMLKAAATGDSVAARSARDMFVVTDQLLAKVKVSNEAEADCNFKVSTIESTDDITHRREKMLKLRDTQKDVVTFLRNFDTSCRDAMSHDNFPSEFVNDSIASARKNGHVDDLIALWDAKIKLTTDFLAQFDYLAKTYGSWNMKDGKVVFSDTDALATYKSFIDSLQQDVKDIGDEQKKIVQ